MRWGSIVLVCMLLTARQAHSQMIELTAGGVVLGTFLTRVVDGNTIELFTGVSPLPSFTIRLARIDAPEPDQPYGNEARRHLEDLLQEEYVLSCSAREADVHGRSLANCGAVNRVMVIDGSAWASVPHSCRRFVSATCSAALISLQDDERQARAARRGLWAQVGEAGRASDSAPLTIGPDTSTE
jgi:micrococcal nuclease